MTKDLQVGSSPFDQAWALLKIDASDITDFIHHSLENGPSKRSILTDGGDWPSDPSEHESHCFDFSDNLHHLIQENGGKAQIMNHPDDPAIHQWVYHPASGLHFDAQTPYGVEDWKGLGGLYD